MANQLQQFANELGITQPVNGSWLQALAEFYGATSPINGSWLQALAENATPGGGGGFNITTSIEVNVIQIDNNGDASLILPNTFLPGRQDVFNIGDNDFMSVNGVFNSNVRKFDKKEEKYFISGGPLLFGNITYRCFLKLNSDFTIDESFNLTGAGFNNTINDFHILNDGKIVVGGMAQFYDLTNVINRIARLNSDGTLDTTFDTGTGFNDAVNKLKFTSDNKFLIGGQFTSFNGTAANRIVKLNLDGSLDTLFNIGTGFNNVVRQLFEISDKIYVCGQFTSYNGTTRNRIVRLNLDGSLDTTFDPGTGFNNSVLNISFLSDGRVVCVGDFTSYNGTTRNRIAILNTDGSLDTSFDPGTGFNTTVWDVTVTSNDKIVCVGNFVTYNEITSNRIIRLNDDGTQDTSFETGTGFNSGPTYVDLTENDNIFVAANFTSYKR